MSGKNYYKILGIPRDASAEDIRRAYRRLAARYHPDRNRGQPAAAERMKEINEAYQVLRDPAQRRRYDNRGGGTQRTAYTQTTGQAGRARPYTYTVYQRGAAPRRVREAVEVPPAYRWQMIFGALLLIATLVIALMGRNQEDATFTPLPDTNQPTANQPLIIPVTVTPDGLSAQDSAPPPGQYCTVRSATDQRVTIYDSDEAEGLTPVGALEPGQTLSVYRPHAGAPWFLVDKTLIRHERHGKLRPAEVEILGCTLNATPTPTP